METHPDKGTYLATFTNSRAKAWMFYTSWLLVAFSLFWLVSDFGPQFFPQAFEDHSRAQAHITLALILAVFTPCFLSLHQYLYHKIKLTAYSKGLDVAGIGFFTWAQCRITVEDKSMDIVVETKAFVKTILHGDVMYFLDAPNRADSPLYIQTYLSSLFRSCTPDEFCNKIVPYCPKYAGPSPDDEDAEFWKETPLS